MSKICAPSVSTTTLISLKREQRGQKTYKVHVLEVAVEVATDKVGGRRAPAGGIGIARVDVGRDLRGREIPDLDGRAGPERSVDAAAVGIEGGSIGSGSVGDYAAAVVATAGTAIAIALGARDELVGLPQGTIFASEALRALMCTGMFGLPCEFRFRRRIQYRESSPWRCGG
jgi:hypothetical protein